MKCIKCNKEGATYLNRKNVTYQRVVGKGKSTKKATIDDVAICKKCGFKGKGELRWHYLVLMRL